jgi:hypothetical protein
VRERAFATGGRLDPSYNYLDEFEWRRNPRCGIGYRHQAAIPGNMRFAAVDFLYAYWKMRWKSRR